MITAGGAMFAAFPQWYATLFSGFYLALVLMLLALILRGVAFEFRSKQPGITWRRWWDRAIFLGSFLPALLWGVALANFVRGVPIDANMMFTGDLLTLLNPYGLLGGVAAVAIFLTHGANLPGAQGRRPRPRAAEAAIRRNRRRWRPCWWAVLIVATYLATDIMTSQGVIPPITAFGAGGALLATGWFVREKRYGWSFAMTSLYILLTIATVFRGLFPRVMISTTDAAYSLTVTNAAASEYTLSIMTVVALIFVPIVLLYQGWTYWVFRKRLTTESKLEY
jgi:cytochrome d ubiquinol oxidase subunit II